jgi:hypothetical protein
MTFSKIWIKGVLFAAISVLLMACAADPNLGAGPQAVKPIGDFKLGHLVVFADNVKKGPMSRDATPEQLKTALEAEMRSRFGGLTGKKYFNIGVAVDVYALARAGIPLVLTPSSALAVTVNIWDDSKNQIIIEEDKQFSTLEKLSANLLIGSGLTMTAEEQWQELVVRTVDKIEAYMRENEALFIAE